MNEMVFSPFLRLLVLYPSVVDIEKTEVVTLEVVELFLPEVCLSLSFLEKEQYKNIIEN